MNKTKALGGGATIAASFVGSIGISGAHESWEYDRGSWYNGNRTVTGQGHLWASSSGSLFHVRAIDTLNDGNNVYASAKHFKLTSQCSSLSVGVGPVTVGSSECGSASTTHRNSYSTPEVSGVGAIADSGHRVLDWCNSNGKNCANDGYKVVAQGCAQFGWPIPDNCTNAYVEYHAP